VRVGPAVARTLLCSAAEEMMTHERSLHHLLDRTLAFAHAALDDSAPRLLVPAMRHTEHVLRHIGQPPLTLLGDAHELLLRVGQLRALRALLERRIECESRLSH
jgi:hypothetical protein